MARRLSALLSLSRDEKDQHSERSGSSDAGSLEYAQSSTTAPAPRKLHKHNIPSPFEGYNDGNPPLAPPPFSHNGLYRPPSSQRSDSRPGSQADSRAGSRAGSRASSPPSLNLVRSRDNSRSRPQTPSISVPPDAMPPARPVTPTSTKSKKKSWISTRSDRKSYDSQAQGYGQQAWIAGLREFVGYDVTTLLYGEKVPELWNDQGDTIVYLYPPSSGKGPCFRLDSVLLADSRALVNLRMQSPSTAVDKDGDMQVLQHALSEITLPSGQLRPPSQASSISQPSINFSAAGVVSAAGQQKHVYLPLGFDEDLSYPESEPQGNDFELILLYRNFFAFLAGGALVATPRQVTLFSIFMGISTILRRFSFTNADGSTFGDVPTTSFARYCDELRLSDVRSSREKTIEAIVLGEQVKSWALYNEGFTHAVGRLADIKAMRSPKYEKMSPITMNRLERAQLDLEQRLMTVRGKLEDYEFPSMFAGIADSQSSSRASRFKEWKAAFLDVRKFTIAHYRRKYGSWPPKASSKKNNFEESGLNRLLLREVYKDFTDLYDVLVDRSSLTTRTVEMAAMTDNSETSDMEFIQHAVRRIESEYDRAAPPVMPPIPFDAPLLPQFSNSFNRDHVLGPDAATLQGKKLRENEVNEVLLGSYNRESINASTWIQDFFNYERRSGGGKTLDQIVDYRCGHWLFLYAVLQSLPMTVVDARDLKHTDGVEYFLCVAPRGGRPWVKEDQSTSRAWYNVASGGGVVSLPADLIDHSVEGIYRRSHCWTVATRWAETLQRPTAALQPQKLQTGSSPFLNPQQAPYLDPGTSPLMKPLSSASSNELRNVSSRSSVNLGLDAMEAPPPQVQSRPKANPNYNPNLTFDSILGGSEDPKAKGKRGKK
ncbi:hypothetical protein EDD37DRAFT_174017 [Exophiala viscosa]|uniref:uncharacterized protein n=1 Tax=Exophiala viscosa TaxID=2486360 RepID=UPI00219A000B|nr:hypothetical protein EDD37DRAFT_174017 [Exophiala viscosa]